MRYFYNNHKAGLVRLGAGVLLSLLALTLCLTVVPSHAPSGMHNIIPFLVYGVPAMFITACIVITLDEPWYARLGATGLAAFLAFWWGAVVGSGAGMDTVQTPGFGWFFAITCGAAALVGGGIGFVFPRGRELSDLQTGWWVATHRCY